MSAVVLTIEEAIPKGLQSKYGSVEWVQGKRISLPLCNLYKKPSNVTLCVTWKSVSQ